MRRSALAIVLTLGLVGAGRRAHAQGAAIHVAIGAGKSFADRGASDELSGSGLAIYGRISGRSARAFSAVADFWMISVPVNGDIVTGPCRPADPSCVGGSLGNQGTRALVLAPALVAREGYEKVSLLYRLGPTTTWFTSRSADSPPLALGLQAGLSILTTRGQRGVLVSIDYLRMFRGSARPRWFVPITVGLQI